jgi:hypothetical protein
MEKTRTLERSQLRKLAASKGASSLQKELASLRIAYSEDNRLLVNNIKTLIGKERIYPHHYPGQASGRTSTIDPPITNWPRSCVSEVCRARLHSMPDYGDRLDYIDHAWTDECWSIRDIQVPDAGEVLIVHDHDNIEGRIHDLILNDEEALKAHEEGLDLHTITCCQIFGWELPQDLKNPHGSDVDKDWRLEHAWQGKDTRWRVLAKNFNHGSKYARNENFVTKIPGIERYGVAYSQLKSLAKKYIASKGKVWLRKLALMDDIRHRREARSLYGFRRLFFDSSEDTGKEGFSHMISATVSDYNNLTIALLSEWFGKYGRLAHNAHDGDKFFVANSFLAENYLDKGMTVADFANDYKAVVERPLEYQGRSITLTASVKVHQCQS